MPRYLITTRRDQRGSANTAADVVTAEPGVTVINSENPHMVTIDTSKDVADRLRQKLQGTHFVEPEIRRSLT
jgi:hypothetical protein